MNRKRRTVIFFFNSQLGTFVEVNIYRGDASIVDASIFFRRMAAETKKKQLQVIKA